MATVTMTGRERVNAALARRDHDRVPRFDSYWSETIERWKTEGLDGGWAEAREAIGTDMHDLECFPWPSPFPGRDQAVAEDAQTRTFVNNWGETVRYWKGRSGTPEHIGWSCETADAWRARARQALVEFNPSFDAPRMRDNQRRADELGRWTFITALESFEALRHLAGDVATMIGMAEHPEWIIDMSRVYTDAMLRQLDAAMATGIRPDGVWCYGDMAFNHATMCSPAMYRDLIWPDHKRLCDWAHERGMKFIYHTDGNVNGVIDLYLEAGFDSLQPLEAKAQMDVRELAPSCGDRLTLFGNIDVMILATNDLHRIEHEIATKIAPCKPHRCYMYHSDHSVPPTTSWQTYLEVARMLDQHGRYD
jgi:uroporphyrinogen decarboxylase